MLAPYNSFFGTRKLFMGMELMSSRSKSTISFPASSNSSPDELLPALLEIRKMSFLQLLKFYSYKYSLAGSASLIWKPGPKRAYS